MNIFKFIKTPVNNTYLAISLLGKNLKLNIKYSFIKFDIALLYAKYIMKGNINASIPRKLKIPISNNSLIFFLLNNLIAIYE